MQNYVTVLDRKDSTAIMSFRKALLLEVKNLFNGSIAYLANIEGNEVSLTDWSSDLNGLVTTLTSFYGAITHVNITTTKRYTIITPYILGDKGCDYLILKSSINLPNKITIENFKEMILPRVSTLTLISLYEKNANINFDKDRYVEIINEVSNAIKASPSPLKGIVIIDVADNQVKVSFTNNIERFTSSIFAITHSADIAIGKTNPVSIVGGGKSPFVYYVLGLKSSSPTSFGTATSLTVKELLGLYKQEDIVPLTSNAEDTNIYEGIITLLEQYFEQTVDNRVSSNPLD